MLLFSPVLYSAVCKARSPFLICTLGIVCAILTAVHANPFLSVAAMTGLGTFLAVHLFRSLRTAYSAWVFRQLAELARELRGAVEQGNVEGPVARDSTLNPVANSVGDDRMMHPYTYYALADLAADRIQDLLTRRVFDLYVIASWFYTVVVTSAVYGFVYCGLYRIDPWAFTSSDDAGFLQFDGFSLGLLTTGSLYALQPASTASNTHLLLARLGAASSS